MVNLTNTPDEIYDLTARFLFVHWRAIDSDVKRKYARDIWRMFQDAVRTAANQTATLSGFTHKLCRRFGDMQVGSNAAERAFLADLYQKRLDNILLRALREAPEYVVLLVRDLNNQQRAEFEERIALENGEEI